jgi:hypothetical protein
MKTVIAALNAGRTIDAIKEFRVLYSVALMDAKNAIEAIRDAIREAPPPAEKPGSYVVLTRYNGWSDEYAVHHCDDKAEAMGVANNLVNTRTNTVVARIVSESIEVTTRVMKDAA